MIAKPLPAGRPWQAGLPATTKTARRDTTRWDPVSKTQTTARAVLLAMAGMTMALSRRCVLGFWHTERPTRGSAGTINVPVPYKNII
jgi:hypothetical protein